jgi:hypothetical protein
MLHNFVILFRVLYFYIPFFFLGGGCILMSPLYRHSELSSIYLPGNYISSASMVCSLVHSQSINQKMYTNKLIFQASFLLAVPRHALMKG